MGGDSQAHLGFQDDPCIALETLAKNIAHAIGSELERQVLRGGLGSILGGKR